MSWPSRRSIWGAELDRLQHEIAAIAATIGRFEPVIMCANPGAARAAQVLCGPRVDVIDFIPVDDLWMRDTGPVVRVDPELRAVDAIGLNFNGWGRKQAHSRDRRVAGEVSRVMRLPFSKTAFVGEGGAIETDGDGTIMATESSLVNSNRNPGLSRTQVEEAVLQAYGARKMIWLKGVRGRDITDDHVDATSRFIRPGVVMVQVPPRSRRDIYAQDARQQMRTLAQATDARGRRLRIIPMAGPRRVRSTRNDFLDSYVNFAVVNGGVVAAQFGDAARDRDCRRTLARAFPGREVVQLQVDALHGGGGGIHCATIHEPL